MSLLGLCCGISAPRGGRRKSRACACARARVSARFDLGATQPASKGLRFGASCSLVGRPRVAPQFMFVVDGADAGDEFILLDTCETRNACPPSFAPHDRLDEGCPVRVEGHQVPHVCRRLRSSGFEGTLSMCEGGVSKSLSHAGRIVVNFGHRVWSHRDHSFVVRSGRWRISCACGKRRHHQVDQGARRLWHSREQ